MITAVYSSIGDTLTHYDLDADAAALQVRATIKMPSVVQYGAPDPSNRYLYVATSDSERGSGTVTGATHTLCALRIQSDGALTPHGPPVPLRQRAIHTSVDRDGRYILTAYNAPPHVSVHLIRSDGTIGDAIEQPADLDLGIFPHQIQTTPSNHAAILATRGHNPGRDRPNGNPGALKLFGFENGRLWNLASIAPGGRNGYGYGPRHLAFHPSQRWIYVLVELQNQLHVHHIHGDVIDPEPAFVKPLTQFPPQPGIIQVGGAIHVHPQGHVVYASNRVSATTNPEGPFPFVAGENNIAVFSINSATGEPTPVQFADPHGFHVRSFTIDPGGRFLIAARLAAMAVRVGESEQIVPAGLSLFRIGADGQLTFAGTHDVQLPPGVQHMWVRAIPIPPST